jgi:hypothetical protein
MKSSNVLSGAVRSSEVSLVWREIKSGAGLVSFEIPRCTAVRIRSATAGLTVTFDGILAATMDTAEVMLFNSGLGLTYGLIGDVKDTVTLVVSGNCFIQMGCEAQSKWENGL